MISMSEVGWIAGFLEGEGYFTLIGRTRKTPRLEASQVDICPIDRLHGWFGGTVYQDNRGGEYGRFRGNRQPCWRWFVNGQKAAEVMMTIWALVGTKRREEIERVIEVWKKAEVTAPARTECKNCGSSLSPENIEWVSREDGKGRRKWCKACGWRIGG